MAVLDDYQDVALTSADWSPVTTRAAVTVFNDHVDDADSLVERLAPFDVVFVLRERTPSPHFGYIADRSYRIFHRDAVAAIAEWLAQNDYG